MTLKEGDNVILPAYGGTSVKLSSDLTNEKDSEVFLYRESEILAKLNE